MSLSKILLNYTIVVYRNAPVAAIGIVFKANMFITFLQMGLANEVQLIPLLYLLNAVAGIHGVIYGQALTDYIAVILSTIIWKQYQNSITKEKDSVK